MTSKNGQLNSSSFNNNLDPLNIPEDICNEMASLIIENIVATNGE